MDTQPAPSNRLLLRGGLRDVGPLVARVLAVPDDLELTDLHEVFLAMLDWDEDPGFIIRIHAQELNSFRRNTRGRRLRDFQLRRQEKFLYICDTLDLWEWECRVLASELGTHGDEASVCPAGRGAHLLLQTRTRVLNNDLGPAAHRQEMDRPASRVETGAQSMCHDLGRPQAYQ